MLVGWGSLRCFYDVMSGFEEKSSGWKKTQEAEVIQFLMTWRKWNLVSREIDRFLARNISIFCFFLFFKSLKPAQLNKNSICNHNTTILGSRSCPQTKIKSFLESWGVSWNNLFHYSHCHRPSRMILFMKRKKRFIHLLRLWKKLIIFWWGTHWALAFSRAVKESFRECYLRWVAAINT